MKGGVPSLQHPCGPAPVQKPGRKELFLSHPCFLADTGNGAVVMIPDAGEIRRLIAFFPVAPVWLFLHRSCYGFGCFDNITGFEPGPNR